MKYTIIPIGLKKRTYMVIDNNNIKVYENKKINKCKQFIDRKNK